MIGFESSPGIARFAPVLFILLAVLASPAPGLEPHGEKDKKYIVLSTGYAPKAARMLAGAHGATVRPFKAAKLPALKSFLRKKKPDYVALVMDPEEIDLSFHKAFLCVACALDKDPYVDLSFGYITGRSPEATEAFVKEILGAPQKQTLSRAATVAGGPKGCYVRSEKGLFGQDVDLVQALNPAKEGRQKEVLEGRQLILFNAHGGPFGGGGGLEAADLKGLRLSGTVLFNGACFNGVVSTGGRYAQEKLFALAVLDTGVAAYYAGLSTTNSGLRAQASYYAAVDGMTLGDASRMLQDRLVTNLRGLRLEALLALDVKGEHDPVYSRFIGGTHPALFGDPGARPFGGSEDALFRCETEPAPGGWKATIRMKGCSCREGAFLSFWQYYPNWLDWRTRSVYCAVPLPDGTEGVSSVVAVEKGGVVLGDPFFGLDRRGKKSILHVVLPVPLGTFSRMREFSSGNHEFVLSIRKGKCPRPARALLDPADDALRCCEIDLTGGSRRFSLVPGRLPASKEKACKLIISRSNSFIRKGGRRKDLFLCYRATAYYLLGMDDKARADYKICFVNPTLLEINFLQGKPLAWARSLGAVPNPPRRRNR